LDAQPAHSYEDHGDQAHILKKASTTAIAIEDDTVERYSFGDAATPIGCDQRVGLARDQPSGGAT